VATNAAGNGAASSAAATVADASPPSNTGPGTTAPSLSGSGAVGTALTCAPGSWTGADLTYGYSWSRNGVPIADTGSDRYVVLSADVGSSISCTVTARNTAGSATAGSPAVSLDAVVAGAPTPTGAPVISGAATLGQTLTCSTGTWTGAPTSFVRLWQRDGETVGTGATHVLVAADQTASLRCVVVAANAAGKGAARSGPVRGGACDGPVGVTINAGAAETTSPAVQLSIKAPTGVTTISISNNADLSGAVSVPVSGTCSYAWTMDSVPGLPLTWSVYVRFDGAGTTYQDSIVVNQPATVAGRR
ncbi:MAG: hypothetical protein WBP61_18015, partial [Nocardioides sp.]